MNAAPDSGKLAGLHVCLVTPGHPATNPRLVKEADTLVAEGARVTVVHGRFIAWADAADACFATRAWQRIGVAFGPLAAAPIRFRQAIAHRLARLRERIVGRRGGTEAALAMHPIAADLEAAVRSVRADVYLAHNLAGLAAAGPVADAHGALLGFDAEDDHVEELADLPVHRGERQRRDALLREWLRHCAHRTAASPMMANELSARYERAFESVLNVFPCADAAALSGPAESSADSLYWASQTVGPGRGLDQVVEAMLRMRHPARLVLRGHAQAGYVEHLRARLAAGGASPSRVVLEPPLPPSELTGSFGGHALALSTEIGDTRNHQICLGNKIFHALLAGTPVLLSDTPAQRALAESLGPAALCIPIDDPVALGCALDAWLGDPARRRVASSHAWAVARARYCWDVERQRFLDTLSKALWTRGANVEAMS